MMPPNPMLEKVGQTAQRKYFRAVLMKFFETCGVVMGILRWVLYYKEKGDSEMFLLHLFGLASEPIFKLGRVLARRRRTSWIFYYFLRLQRSRIGGARTVGLSS